MCAHQGSQRVTAPLTTPTATAAGVSKLSHPHLTAASCLHPREQGSVAPWRGEGEDRVTCIGNWLQRAVGGWGPHGCVLQGE